MLPSSPLRPGYVFCPFPQPLNPVLTATQNSNASPFNTPANCNNTCSSQQQGGFNWNDHPAGNPSNIGDFSFHNCQVKNSIGKRDQLGRRTGGNCIAGHADSKSGPGMKCSSHGFSINEVHVSTENDKQPIECHYHMPDNSICKTSHTCGKDVTVIKNDQCGNATSMSVAIPTHAPTPSCTVSIHTVSFHCGSASYTPTVTPHPETKTSSSKTEAKTTTHHSEATTTPHYSEAKTTTHHSESKPTPKTESPKNATTPAGYSKPSSSIPLSTGVSSAPSSSIPLSTGASSPQSSSSSSAMYRNATTTSHSTWMHTTTTSCSSGQVITSTAQAPTQVTVTGVKTTIITSCAPTVTDCPARQTPVTTMQTVTSVSSCSSGQEFPTTLTAPSVITTTFQTSTPVAVSPQETPKGSPVESSSVGPAAVTSAAPYTTTSICPPGYVVSPTGSGSPVTLTAPSVSSYVVTPSAGTPQQGTSLATSPAAPTEQAAAPNVLPRCLNSFESKCKSNTDSDCYCKDADFITQAIQCAAAHAESDEDAAQAISYLQGICAPHIASNPAIVTACPSYITPPPAPAATNAAPMTTVPYSSGSYSTTITAPQVAFATTGSAPGLYAASPAAATSAPAAAAQPPYPTGSYSYGAPAGAASGTAPMGTAASTGFATYAPAKPTSMAQYNPANGAGKTVVSGLAAAAAGAVAVMLF